MSYDYLEQNGYETSMMNTQTYASGDSLKFEYNDRNQIDSVLFKASNDSTYNKKFGYEYDHKNRLAIYKSYNMSGVAVKSEFYQYDESNNLIKITDESGNTTEYMYDSLGNLSEIKHEYNNTTNTINYDQYEMMDLFRDEINETSFFEADVDYTDGSMTYIQTPGTVMINDGSVTVETFTDGSSILFGDMILVKDNEAYDFELDVTSLTLGDSSKGVNWTIMEYSYNAEGDLELTNVYDLNFFTTTGLKINNYTTEVGTVAIRISLRCEDTFDITFDSMIMDYEPLEKVQRYDKTYYTTQDSYSVIKDYVYETGVLQRLDEIALTNSVFNLDSSLTYLGDTTRISRITYVLSDELEDEVTLEFSYYYDDIGNITNIFEVFNSTIVNATYYEYDSLNQLIVEEMNDYTSCTNAEETCFTKFIKYDQRGNITETKKYAFGEEETIEPTIPTAYQYNYGSNDGYVILNSIYEYDDIYEINVGQTPSFNFAYYDSATDSGIFGMTTSYVGGNLDTSTEGYYYRQYEATSRWAPYEIYFKIIIKVGNFSSLDNIPDEHFKYVYESVWQDRLDKILEVTYDSSGNPTETTLNDYTYDSSESGDQGNPTSISNFYYNGNYYDSASLEYNGRQLTKITLTDTSLSTFIIEYTYNDQGYRTSKTLGSETITYELNNDKVIYETNGTYDIMYSYDIDGSIISYHYDDGTNEVEIYYVRNLQGDIKKLIDNYGNILVEYTYDAWGNIVEIEYNSSYNAEALRAHLYNRYFYRGYRYDEETALYYLNSRYYNPVVGRFINADGLLGQQGNILGHNMYAYTLNNPVMYSDISGEFPILIILSITAIVGLGLTIGGVATDNNTMTAIGLTMVAIPAIATGGIALASGIATGASLTGVIGGTTLAAGIGTGVFATAEYQETFTGTNWILNTGMSEGTYIGVMIGLATVATMGTAASSFSYSYNIKSINSLGRYDNFYGMQFKTGAGKTRVLSFHTHGHGGGISQWHWQLQKWDPYWGKTSSTIGRYSWWKLWQWR